MRGLFQGACRLALLLVALLATDASGAASLGDLEIWWDETPVTMSVGTRSGKWVWKGKTGIPLQLDESKGSVSGAGAFKYTYQLSTSTGCGITCEATRAVTVKGRPGSGVLDLAVTHAATQARCTAQCKGKSVTMPGESRDAFTDQIKVSTAGGVPLRHASAANGPALFYRMAGPCDSDPGGPLVKVDVVPGANKWEVTRLETATLADVRGKGAPNPVRFGYTAHAFSPAVDLIDKTKPARGGDGMCYWVESVRVRFAPIETMVPGIDYPPNRSCEFGAIKRHEELHVGDFKSLLNQASGEVTRVLQASALPRASAPMLVKQRAEGRAAADRIVEGTVAPLQDRWLQRRDQSIAARDRKDLVERVKAECPGGWRK